MSHFKNNFKTYKPMKILNYKKKVKEIMEQYPEARDNDLTLYSLLISKLNYSGYSYSFNQIVEFINLGILPDIQYISRCRRFVENESPELRGLLYEKKHERYQKEVKEELGYVATEWDAEGMRP